MGKSSYKEALRQVSQVIENLALEKQVAAAKWLEGVIVAQTLTNDERDAIVKAANAYVETIVEEDYVSAVNALIAYLGQVQKSVQRKLKKANNKRKTGKKTIPPIPQ